MSEAQQQAAKPLTAAQQAVIDSINAAAKLAAANTAYVDAAQRETTAQTPPPPPPVYSSPDAQSGYGYTPVPAVTQYTDAIIRETQAQTPPPLTDYTDAATRESQAQEPSTPYIDANIREATAQGTPPAIPPSNLPNASPDALTNYGASPDAPIINDAITDLGLTNVAVQKANEQNNKTIQTIDAELDKDKDYYENPDKWDWSNVPGGYTAFKSAYEDLIAARSEAVNSISANQKIYSDYETAIKGYVDTVNQNRNLRNDYLSALSAANAESKGTWTVEINGVKEDLQQLRGSPTRGC